MKLRLALFGQALFGREVTERLAALGHEIAGVWTPPEGSRPDPLATLAREREWPLFFHRYFRRKGEAIAEIVDEYRAVSADLNVLPFTTAILPPEIAQHPRHGSICFHPSLLPAYRGGAALSWQIIQGEQESGVSVFKLGDHVDGGPLLVQRGGVEISPTDTMASLYFEKLYPLGVEAMVEAVQALAQDRACFTPQGTEGASRQGLITDETARIDWSLPAHRIDRLLRGCDPAPGATTMLGDRQVRLFGASLVANGEPAMQDGPSLPGTVLRFRDGAMEIATVDGVLRVSRIAIDGGKKLPSGNAGLEPGVRFHTQQEDRES